MGLASRLGPSLCVSSVYAFSANFLFRRLLLFSRASLTLELAGAQPKSHLRMGLACWFSLLGRVDRLAPPRNPDWDDRAFGGARPLYGSLVARLWALAATALGGERHFYRLMVCPFGRGRRLGPSRVDPLVDFLGISVEPSFPLAVESTGCPVNRLSDWRVGADFFANLDQSGARSVVAKSLY